MSVLDQIVKAYDIRGTVPDQLNADVAHALGVGFAIHIRQAEVPRWGSERTPTGDLCPPVNALQYTAMIVARRELQYFACNCRDGGFTIAIVSPTYQGLTGRFGIQHTGVACARRQ